MQSKLCGLNLIDFHSLSNVNDLTFSYCGSWMVLLFLYFKEISFSLSS
jgi:hypothetical protein